MNLATLKGVYDENITLTISSSPCTIGRSKEADFIIAHVNVSRNHCEIIQEKFVWKIIDYSSSGTYVNDKLVGKGKSVCINNEDIIRFGPIESKLCWRFQISDSFGEDDSSIKQQLFLNVETSNVLISGDSFSVNKSEEKEGVEIETKSKTTASESNLPLIKESDTAELEKESHQIQQEKSLVDAKCNILENVADVMEAEFQCTICSELFLTAITLGCTHTFCKYCIDLWKKKQKTCPICRKKITNETRSLVVDNYIDKMIGNLSSELKERRETIIKERSEVEPPRKRSKAKNKKS